MVLDHYQIIDIFKLFKMFREILLTEIEQSKNRNNLYEKNAF